MPRATRLTSSLIVVITTALVTATSATAQIGPIRTPTLPALPSGVTDRLPVHDGALGRQAVDGVLRAPSRVTRLIRRSDGALQADPFGWPVVRGEIVAIDLSDDARTRILADGFIVAREERLEALTLTTTVLAPPRRLSLERAIRRLRELAPDAEVTYNHVHSPAGAVANEVGGWAPGPRPSGNTRLGLIDTGVEATHPALISSNIVQRGFSGPARVGAHGTAVASLMVGRSQGFSGADPGAGLLVADVYGGQPAGGSSTALAAALAWMLEQDAAVVNISLVGPRNSLIERAVARARSRGLIIVAAVGNDGPAAPPLFPAAYEGVIGVTAVNARNRALPEAARGPQVDFAAPGADMAAAGQAGSWTSVRGSSFASPVVAGLLGRRAAQPAAIAALSRQAVDLGDRGHDAVYGAGLVGGGLRTEPRSLGARGRLTR